MMNALSKNERFRQIERLVAQDLAVFLATKSAGLQIEDIHMVLRQGATLQLRSADSLVIDLPRAIAQLSRKEYIRKRIFILCARAFAMLLLSSRDVERGKAEPNPSEFWDQLRENGDDSLLREICALYLIEDERDDSSDNLEDSFQHRASTYIADFGLKPLAKFLTSKEFFSLLGSLVNEVDLLATDVSRFELTINDKVTCDYEPGEATVILDKRPQDHGVQPALTNAKPPKIWTEEERRLVAHEMGHWTAARIVGIETSQIQLDFAHGTGSCTVYVGEPAFKWELERYLKARIAVLCSGSLADCWVKYPLERQAIGNKFFFDFEARGRR